MSVAGINIKRSMATVTVVRGEKPSADYVTQMSLERGFQPTPRRMKTKKSEALHLLADIEVEGPAVAPGQEVHYSSQLLAKEKLKAQAFTQTYSKAVPTEEALALIAAQTKGGRVLELFAETGIWSYLLSALYDVDMLPTDEKPSVILQYGRVELIKPVDAVDRFSDCKSLLLSWPPTGSEEDYDAVVRFRGEIVVFVGIPGKCGSAKLNSHLDQNYIPLVKLPMRSWYWDAGEQLIVFRKK